MYKVLFLASWYPSRVGAFDGDFIERHAKAISLFHKVFVVYVVKDPSIKNGKITVNKEITGNLISFRGYYPYSKFKKGFLEKIHSNYLSFHLHKKIFKMIQEEFGMPDIVHLNVLMKAGIFARWLKRKYSLPYVLSENWTGYYPENKSGYLQKSVLYKKLSKRIYNDCDLPLPVTKDLGERMNKLFAVTKQFMVIPNVVNTSLFYFENQIAKKKKRLIHISTLGYHKNIWGILHSIKKLFQQRQDFELLLVGKPSSEIIEWSKKNGLNESCVVFTGLISYAEVASYLRKADALIMFSRYENLPCVILEALCCGVPVVASDVGGIREVINKENGILIHSENENELIEAMNYMLDNLEKYNKKNIASSASEKFNYQTVVQQFTFAYQTVLKPLPVI
jgi:glycosyltransferase involved in cell wall biosynthesis